jgi:hypothetical protein
MVDVFGLGERQFDDLLRSFKCTPTAVFIGIVDRVRNLKFIAPITDELEFFIGVKVETV